MTIAIVILAIWNLILTFFVVTALLASMKHEQDIESIFEWDEYVSLARMGKAIEKMKKRTEETEKVWEDIKEGRS